MANKTKTHAGSSAPAKVAAAPTAGLSKKDLVRQAMGHLGNNAKPVQIQAHIKDKFGVEMTTNHISASKSDIQRQGEGAAKPAVTVATAPKPAAKPAAPKPAVKKHIAQKSAAQTTTAPKPTPAPTTSKYAKGNGHPAATISLEDIRATNDLVARVGVAQMQELIALLAN